MIEWKDFIEGQAPVRINVNHVVTNIKCPVCGEALLKDISVVLTSNPPKYQYMCKKCNWHGYGPDYYIDSQNLQSL